MTLTKDQDKKELPSPLKENMIERDWTPWEKPKGGRIEGGGWEVGVGGAGGSGGRIMEATVLNNNKKKKRGKKSLKIHMLYIRRSSSIYAKFTEIHCHPH